MVEEDRAAFVETNTRHAVPILLNRLQAVGMKPEQVEFIIVTHAHLDHAGGTAELLKYCPNAKVLAHPRATPHLVDPHKLVEASEQVYGKELFRDLYGHIDPISQERIQSVVDGEEVQFGTRRLKFMHTRGHANHHMCILDSGSEGIFTGDAFGLCYPELQGSGLFIIPSSSPSQFDPDEALVSVRKVLEAGARKAYLTHFGELEDMDVAADQLERHLEFHAELLKGVMEREWWSGEGAITSEGRSTVSRMRLKRNATGARRN